MTTADNSGRQWESARDMRREYDARHGWQEDAYGNGRGWEDMTPATSNKR